MNMQMQKAIDNMPGAERAELLEYVREKQSRYLQEFAISIVDNINALLTDAQLEGLHFTDNDGEGVFQNMQFNVANLKMKDGRPIIGFNVSVECESEEVDY